VETNRTQPRGVSPETKFSLQARQARERACGSAIKSTAVVDLPAEMAIWLGSSLGASAEGAVNLMADWVPPGGFETKMDSGFP
jgi:hypothetical protein